LQDVLRPAWAAVRRNNGAPDIDKITLVFNESPEMRMVGGICRLRNILMGYYPACQLLSQFIVK
jgi:hypothetical protein